MGRRLSKLFCFIANRKLNYSFPSDSENIFVNLNFPSGTDENNGMEERERQRNLFLHSGLWFELRFDTRTAARSCKDHLSYWGFGDGVHKVGHEMTKR